jgi:phenylalanyl-tRNA synthetase beta chain
MKILVSWLKEFVDVASDPRQLKSDLTMIGLNTESLAPVGNDWVLDLEVTTNRPDCLSHYGIARELATHYRQPLKELNISAKESGGPAQGVVSIEIADPDLCARYCGRMVQNVRVGPSPDWLKKRLEAIGQRPINNVADITNYVLMELGHPLHAFDLSRLKQKKIIVRRAKPGEPLRTLDGVQRTLTRDNLVIADGTHPVALAGVMGGEESEISPNTCAVLLESAWFDPLSIRRTSKSHGMHTEASHRFERGADIEMAPVALDRAAALIQELAGGEILSGMIDVYPRPPLRLSLMFRRSEITRILAADISTEDVERILRGLGFGLEFGGSPDNWFVTAPSFRPDISQEVDLVEEVARHVGYDQLPAQVRPAPPRVERDTTRDKVMTTSSLLVGLGYHEIIAPSMVDPAEGERFSAAPPVVLANPLSQDASAMRSSAVPSMLRAIRWNLDRGTNDVKLFELGKTYNLSASGVPEEHRVLTLGATGHRRPATIYDNEADLNFFDLKGEVESILSAFDAPAWSFEPSGRPYFHPARNGRLSLQGVELAVFGLIRQDLEQECKLRQEVWVADIDFERLLTLPLRSRKLLPISKFPAVERDFSLVVPDHVPYARLSSAIAGLALEDIRAFRAVDRFRGGTIPVGHYSLLLRMDFQSHTHTLTGEEVNQLGEGVLAALEPLGVRLRG